MTGYVLAHHVLLDVSLRGPDGSAFITIEFVVDTGFVGELTLPRDAVQALGLPFVRFLSANLADNSSVELEVYAAEVIWQDVVREVEVLATGIRPLLGTRLLDGCELNIRFADHEAVSVNPL